MGAVCEKFNYLLSIPDNAKMNSSLFQKSVLHSERKGVGEGGEGRESSKTDFILFQSSYSSNADTKP